MTLNELLDVIDPRRETTHRNVQIVRPHEDWNNFDEVPASSFLLVPFGDFKVNLIQGIDTDAIRVDLDWDDSWKDSFHHCSASDEEPIKHGYWEIAIGYDPKKAFQCSECRLMSYDPTEFCPHCGAKMDESTQFNDSNTLNALDALGKKVTENG